MLRRIFALVTVSLLMAGTALAKGKEKILPPYILQARTVAVIVEPGAGIDPEDPRANQVAQKDVETALMNWGRFTPVMGTVEADLIIVIRKGHARLADATISDPRQNDRAGVINPTDNGIGVGGQRGPQPDDPAADHPIGSYPHDDAQHQRRHPRAGAQHQVSREDGGDRSRCADQRHAGVHVDREIAECGEHAACKIEDKEAQASQRLLDVVAENEKIEHVAEQVSPAAMDEHAGQQRQRRR